MDELPAKEILKNNPGLVVLNQELFTDKYGMVVRKGNDELLKAINKVLSDLIADGKIEEYVIHHTSE